MYYNENDGNSKVGFLFGLIGGGGKFLLNINTNYWHNLLEAGFTAIVCGALGVAGKEIYIAIKRALKKNK